VPLGNSAGFSSSMTGCCADGSHIGMTCTVGGVGSGATGWVSGRGTGGDDFARNPSGQVSVCTFHGFGRAGLSAGLELPCDTCTTSTTRLAMVPEPFFRGAVTICRVSPANTARFGRRENMRSASDIRFHYCGLNPCNAHMV
jgi:hypothetical protein